MIESFRSVHAAIGILPILLFEREASSTRRPVSRLLVVIICRSPSVSACLQSKVLQCEVKCLK